MSIGWEAEGPQRETQVKDHPHFSELVFNCTVVVLVLHCGVRETRPPIVP